MPAHRTEALITDMDAPLGSAIGNTLEIIECVETLKGQGPSEVADVVLHIATRMVLLAGRERDTEVAARSVEDALRSGRALETFRSMIQAHGGNPRVVEDYAVMPQAPDRELFRAPATGFVAALRAETLGRASNVLGAGRLKVGDPVDHAVGLVAKVALGAHVAAGEPLIELHHRGGRGLERAIELCRAAVTIADEPPPARARCGEVR